jgi:nitroimidazol reductase NimA-like FMN-containing flavoprotein (pyridoxamine 5'-phosphate oxidase superfamily)
MDLTALTPAQIDAFLPTQRILRLAMDANGERYLVPLGYVWLDGALWCVTLRGRKTRLLEMNPRVAFQIDDSATRDDFDWTSVSGEGEVEFVTDAASISRASQAWFERFSDMPGWAAKQYEARQRGGELVWLRIRPARLSGREGAPPGV